MHSLHNGLRACSIKKKLLISNGIAYCTDKQSNQSKPSFTHKLVQWYILCFKIKSTFLNLSMIHKISNHSSEGIHCECTEIKNQRGLRIIQIKK